MHALPAKVIDLYHLCAINARFVPLVRPLLIRITRVPDSKRVLRYLQFNIYTRVTSPTNWLLKIHSLPASSRVFYRVDSHKSSFLLLSLQTFVFSLLSCKHPIETRFLFLHERIQQIRSLITCITDKWRSV